MIKKTIVTLILVGFLFGFFLIENQNVANQNVEITIQVVYSEQNIYEQQLNVRKGETLLYVLEKEMHVVSVHYVGLGHMITEIRDLKQSGNKYIMIYVDGKASMVGIDGIEIISGMIVTFKLE